MKNEERERESEWRPGQEVAGCYLGSRGLRPRGDVGKGKRGLLKGGLRIFQFEVVHCHGLSC